ncbi:MAG: hypothetical protein ACREL9_14010 [Gemmatimonadales bacterium]
MDQDTGAAIPGVPVTVLDEAGRSAGFWVSDLDGLVRIAKHDRAQLRLRVGLRSEDTIELDARSLPDDPIALTAPRGSSGMSGGAAGSGTGTVTAAATDEPSPAGPHGQVGHVVRFARIGVLAQDADITMPPDAPAAASPFSSAPAAPPGAIRYGVLLEVEQLWQSLGSQAGDLLYSISLGPGDEVKVAVSDGRWRKKPGARERPLEIVARMVAAPAKLLGDGVDAVPLAPFTVTSLQEAVADTVRYLSQRTVQMSEALRHRPLGVTELEAGQPAGGAVRTVRNLRSDGVLTYHFIEPVERYRMIVRTPRLRPAILVPFRLPNLATREVVRRYGHALRRALLDRALWPDIEHVLTVDDPTPQIERRVYDHVAAHLPYYSATIIAAGDAAERFFALAKLRDADGRVLTDVLENVVVGRVGHYVAFPLRSLEFSTPAWRAALADDSAHRLRAVQEMVTLPIPGVWLRAQLSPALMAGEPAAEEDKTQSGRKLRRAGD